jgi:lipoate-protein ligase B
LKPLAVAWLGRVAYDDAVALQESLRRRILDGDEAAERLLLVEHPPVITLGRAAPCEHVLASPSTLQALGVAQARSSRGGAVTYHGPGQLVAYPVMRLVHGVVAHVEALAAAAVAVAAAVGVSARFRRDRPGVWIGDAKLVSVGIHVHRRVAIHGLALNVSTALDAFSLIVACGSGARQTSLALESGCALDPAALAAPFAEAFAHAVGRVAATAPLLSSSPSVE